MLLTILLLVFRLKAVPHTRTHNYQRKKDTHTLYAVNKELRTTASD